MQIAKLNIILSTQILTTTIIIVLSTFFIGCKEENLGELPSSLKFDPHSNMGRSAWQKPQLIIEKIGDLSDKVVADIGAGSGFFSFRFAMKAKKVIAVDIDQDMIDLINLQKLNMPSEIFSKIETRLVPSDDPMLKQNEVDVVVIINTITYISQRTAYLQKLFKLLPQNGKIMVVDFKKNKIPIEAPPVGDRASGEEIQNDLIKAGFKVIMNDENTLDYQYIIIGEKI